MALETRFIVCKQALKVNHANQAVAVLVGVVGQVRNCAAAPRLTAQIIKVTSRFIGLGLGHIR